MSIIELQRTIAEAGRIRIGHQVPISGGRTRPAKLDTFRLTSPDRRRIEEAATLFGGTVKAWAAPAGPQWEVITESTEINVIVPPQAMAFSQFYELWSGGGCQRRCDGQTELLSEGDCLCDPETRVELAKRGEACDIHTRLSVMIRDLPGLALWRIDTQGYYAARELAGAVEIMAMAAGRGILLPARLLLEQRTVKRPGKDGKPQTLRFPVPRLDPGITPGELVALPPAMPVTALGDGTLAAVGAGTDRPRLTPVPRDDSPIPSIAEQSAAPAARTPRRNAATEIPASGRRRNTAGAKQPGDDGYWRSRAFADGADRDIDADRMRAIAAELLVADPDSFSMADLDETAWERIHKVVVGFPPVAEQDTGPEADWTAIVEEAAPPPPVKTTKEPPPPPLTAPELLDLIRGGTVSRDFAGEIFKRRFPTVQHLGELDDEARGRYWREVQDAAAAAAVPA